MKKFTINENTTVSLDIEKLQLAINDEKPKTKKSKSQIFKELYELGMDIAEVSKFTKSHYSFVYGVISNKCEMRETNKITKSDKIRELADQGKTPGQIAKELNSNYSFVFSVVKKHQEKQKLAK